MISSVSARERGFSMVDLLIVLAIGGVIMVMSAAPVARYQQRTAVRGAADHFMATQILARSSAIKYGRLAELHLDNATSRFWIEVDTAGAGTPDTIGPVHDLATDGIGLSSSQPLLCYDASGGATGRGACAASMAVVEFAGHGFADTVWVTAAGNALR